MAEGRHRNLFGSFDEGKFRTHHNWLRLRSDEEAKSFASAEVDLGCFVVGIPFQQCPECLQLLWWLRRGIFPLVKAKLLLTARSTKYHMTIGYALQELEYVITI